MQLVSHLFVNFLSYGDTSILFLVLCQVLQSKEPLIVYFPDSSQWFSRAVPQSSRKEFVSQVKEMFEQLSGSVLLICGQNKVETGSKEKEKFVSCNFFYRLRCTCV